MYYYIKAPVLCRSDVAVSGLWWLFIMFFAGATFSFCFSKYIKTGCENAARYTFVDTG